MDRVLNDVIAEVIGLAVVHPTLDSSPCKPAGEATGMVVATILFAGTLGNRCISGPFKFKGQVVRSTVSGSGFP